MNTLRVGVDAAPPVPMCYGVPGDPDFGGFEIDLLRAIGARLDRDVHFEAALWADLLGRLDTGTLDAVCTAATITPEREAHLLFSLPYLRTQLAIICREDRPVVDLRGFDGAVGVRTNTPAERLARASNVARIDTFHFNDEVYRALDESRIDAVVDDWPIAAWFAAQSPHRRVGARVPGTEAVYGIVFARTATTMKEKVDRALRVLLADGTYDRLYRDGLAPFVGDTCHV